MGDWITFPNGKKGRRAWENDTHRVAAWQSLLRSAHDVLPRPFCDCRHHGHNLELVVRRTVRKERGQLAEAYHLARMPRQGGLHYIDCPFHEVDPRQSGQAAYAPGVVQEMSDGSLRVALRRGLAIRDVAQAPSTIERDSARDSAAGRRAARPRQSRMTELGLLHLLWEKSGTNSWHRGIGRARMWWPGVRQRVMNAASDIMVGRGCPLGEYLVLIGYGDEDGPALLREKAQSCGQNWRMLLLGKVDSLRTLRSRPKPGQPGRPYTSLRFDGAQDYHLMVSASEDWLTRLSRRFPRAMHALDQERADRKIGVIGLVTANVQIRRDGTKLSVMAWADDIALMEVEPETLIPVESGYELQITRALVEAKRAFTKPLRFDAGNDVVHPDFILTDTHDPRGTPMEGFGRDDDRYLTRKAEKVAYYEEVYGVRHWWSWDVACSPRQWPPFPPAAPDGQGDEDE